jgi:ligand-binding sensor domain-containing protein
MTNDIKVTFFSQISMLSIFITSCNGQTKTEQENVTEIKASLTEPARPQGEIIIDTSRQTKLDFSKIAGNFDKVYSNVHNGFQDKAGNIWFSTTGAGTIRFDGKFFNHITTIDKSNNNSITPLLEDKQVDIWFASANGIYRYDGKIFTNIPTESANNTVQTSTLNTSAKRTSISVISAMQDKKGNIWFGTETSGVYRYDGQNLTNFLSQKNVTNSGGLRLNTITSILEDKKGNIWFTSWNNEGLCRYDGKSITNYTPKNGLGDDMIYSIFEDEVGNIWIGSRNHGVWRYDGKSFTNISDLTDLKDETIYSIKQDSNRNFWSATQSKGVWKYDGKTFTNFTTKDGLHNNSVFCIVPEKNGNLWFGSRGMGLSMYDGKIFTDLTKN